MPGYYSVKCLLFLGTPASPFKPLSTPYNPINLLPFLSRSSTGLNSDCFLFCNVTCLLFHEIRMVATQQRFFVPYFSSLSLLRLQIVYRYFLLELKGRFETSSQAKLSTFYITKFLLRFNCPYRNGPCYTASL